MHLVYSKGRYEEHNMKKQSCFKKILKILFLSVLGALYACLLEIYDLFQSAVVILSILILGLVNPKYPKYVNEWLNKLHEEIFDMNRNERAGIVIQKQFVMLTF